MVTDQPALYIASVKAIGGLFEGQMFCSSPQDSDVGAVLDLQRKAHENGVSADWSKVQIEWYSLIDVRKINPAVEFADEYKKMSGV